MVFWALNLALKGLTFKLLLNWVNIYGNNLFHSFNAQDITLKDGAIIDIAARGQGDAGQIHLNAEDNIRLIGTGGSNENSSNTTLKVS